MLNQCVLVFTIPTCPPCFLFPSSTFIGQIYIRSSLWSTIGQMLMNKLWVLPWRHSKPCSNNMFYKSNCFVHLDSSLSSGSWFSSVSVMSNSLRPHGLQYARLPWPSPNPGAYSNACPLHQWCHPTISFSVIPFSSHLQSFPASGAFQMSQFFSSGGQSIGVSASTSVLPTNIQDWFLLGWTGWISLLSKGLSRIFSNTTVQKH